METLADIKKAIQPMLSKWAAQTDLEIRRRQLKSGEVDWCPKRGAKDWLSLRSDKKNHSFAIAVEGQDDGSEHKNALKGFAVQLQGFISAQFGQAVPVKIEWSGIPSYVSYSVSSGESSSTLFRGEELAVDPDDWF